MMTDTKPNPFAPRGGKRAPPSGPRLGARGGIQKRASPRPRMDRDGDLDMDGLSRRGPSSSSGSGRGAPGSQSNAPRGSARGRPQRTGISVNAVEKAVSGGRGHNTVNVRSGMNTRSRGGRRQDLSGLVKIAVKGWSQSKAASNPGGAVVTLIPWLEKKASSRDQPRKIQESRINGGTLYIFVTSDDEPSFTRINNYEFAGASLSVGVDTSPEPQENNISGTASNIKEKLAIMLNKRYNEATRVLDLSALHLDPEFVDSGMFGTKEREAKFFEALMKIANDHFATSTQKREAVMSISLANNNLPDVGRVTALAQTFPDTKQLDLSGNQLDSLKSLEPWRRRFRALALLVLSGNPIDTQVPNYQEEIIRWYPNLQTLNGVQVRTEEAAAAASSRKTTYPLAIQPPNFIDESSIAENFLKQFFPGYDSDRTGLAGAFYDAQSTFSLSVNLSAPHQNEKIAPWSEYIKKSRNLVKITNLPTRVARSIKGPERIAEMWLTIPATRHPDLIKENKKWCIECHPLPGLPDQAGQSPTGVGGLLIVVHGEFGEVNVATAEVTTTRSFDRTLVLGPGNGLGGIRVVSDILVLRAYGGCEGWQPTEKSGQAIVEVQAAPIVADGPPRPANFGQAVDGKTQEHLLKEQMVLQLCLDTRMTLQYSEMCLEQANWDYQVAGSLYEQTKPGLPENAFF